MRSRFGIISHIDFYTPESLHVILRHNAELLKLQADDTATQLDSVPGQPQQLPEPQAGVQSDDHCGAQFFVLRPGARVE